MAVQPKVTLYVVDDQDERSTEAFESVVLMCHRTFGEEVPVEVISARRDPARIEEENVLVLPTVDVMVQAKRYRIVGHVSDPAFEERFCSWIRKLRLRGLQN